MTAPRATSTAARIVPVDGTTREWRCPNCDAMLAQIIGDRVVIRVRDRTIYLRAELEPDQVCWRCGTMSALVGLELRGGVVC